MINRTAPPGSMRYFALLYTPPEKRDALLAMYVIDAEIRESAQSANHDVAHTRLQWWRQEIDRLVNRNPQHPATRVLNEHYQGNPAAFAKLHELMAAADMDLARMTYLNAREVRAYCARSAGAVQELIAMLLQAPGPVEQAARSFANNIGIGIRQAEILRDLRQDAHDGRVYLPLDQLEQHGVKPEELRGRKLDAKAKAALRSFRDLAVAQLRAPAESSGIDRARLRPLLVLAALHLRLLDRIAQRNYDVATERIELGPFEKPWVAWRAARKAR